jgi:hypothetical protein
MTDLLEQAIACNDDDRAPPRLFRTHSGQLLLPAAIAGLSRAARCHAQFQRRKENARSDRAIIATARHRTLILVKVSCSIYAEDRAT